jgi:hypothetical protein
MPHPKWRVVAAKMLIKVQFALSNITYSNFHALTANKLHTSHNILLHLHKLGKLPCEVRTELAGGLATESMT